jgi:site-specific DNA recombinase
LLTNVTYIGQVRYHREVHRGEQPAIVEPEIWQDVQALLAHNGKARASALRSRSRALLQGLLYCRPCGCAMTPAHVNNGNRRYRYYVCSAAQRKGRHTCPSKSLSAADIERYVLEQLAARGRGGFGDPSSRSSLMSSESALRELVARIDYDGTNRQVAITLKPKSPTPKELS